MTLTHRRSDTNYLKKWKKGAEQEELSGLAKKVAVGDRMMALMDAMDGDEENGDEGSM